MKSIKACVTELIDEEILSPLYPNESNDDFVDRICQLCLDEIELEKGFSPLGLGLDVITEIEMIVVEAFRAKIYGYFNLSDYRQSQLKKRLA